MEVGCKEERSRKFTYEKCGHDDELSWLQKQVKYFTVVLQVRHLNDHMPSL